MKSTRNEILRNISGSIKERNGLTAQYPLYRNRLRPIIFSLEKSSMQEKMCID